VINDMKVTISVKYTIDTEVSNDSTAGVHTDGLPAVRLFILNTASVPPSDAPRGGTGAGTIRDLTGARSAG
jgi:hypothetical protein